MTEQEAIDGEASSTQDDAQLIASIDETLADEPLDKPSLMDVDRDSPEKQEPTASSSTPGESQASEEPQASVSSTSFQAVL